MELKLPVTYLESHVPKGKRKARYRPVLVEERFVLPDVSAAAAPVAVTLTGRGKRREKPRELRVWKGALVAPADAEFERELEALRLAAEVNEASHADDALAPPRELARETVRARVQATLDGFVRIGDRVWRRTDEPRIVVVRYETEEGGRVVLLLDDRYRAGFPCDVYFNLRDADKARARADALAREADDPDAPLDLLPEIRIRLPRALQVDAVRGCAGEGASSVAMGSAVAALLHEAGVDTDTLVKRGKRPRKSLAKAAHVEIGRRAADDVPAPRAASTTSGSAPMASSPASVTDVAGADDRPGARRAESINDRLAEVLALLCGERPPRTLVDQIGRLDSRLALERWIERKQRDRLAWASGATVLAAARELAAGEVG